MHLYLIGAMHHETLSMSLSVNILLQHLMRASYHIWWIYYKLLTCLLSLDTQFIFDVMIFFHENTHNKHPCTKSLHTSLKLLWKLGIMDQIISKILSLFDTYCQICRVSSYLHVSLSTEFLLEECFSHKTTYARVIIDCYSWSSTCGMW